MKPDTHMHASRRGAASIALVMVLIIAQFAILAMVLNSSRDQTLAVSRVSSVQAFFAAEAGINMAIREAINDEDFDGNGVVGGITSTSDTLDALHGASIDVTASVVGSDFTLASLGTLADARHAFQMNLELITTGGTIGTPHGVSVNAQVELSGSARIDAFDSTSGAFNPGNDHAGHASVSTNSTSNDHVDLNGSARINGDVYVGVGGNPVNVVDTSGSSTVTGTKEAMTEVIDVPDISAPSGLPASSGNVTYGSSGTTTLTAGTYHYNNLTINGSRTVKISGDVVIYCDGSFSLGGSGEIELNAGATLEIYANKFTINGSGKLNMPDSPATADPSLVNLYQFGTGNFDVGGSGVVIGQVLAPDARVDITGSGHLFGVVQANRISLGGSGKFTQDLAITATSGGGGGGGGGTSSMIVTNWQSVSPQ